MHSSRHGAAATAKVNDAALISDVGTVVPAADVDFLSGLQAAEEA
jgi:hypothetical protein